MDWQVPVQQFWYGLVNGATYVVFASGLALAFGAMGIVNLAHGEFCMLGAMVIYSLMTYLGMNFFVAAILSIAFLGVLGAICNRLAIQPLVRTPKAVFISTMGLSYILLYGSGAAWGSFPRQIEAPFSQILHPGGISISEASIVLLVVAAAAMAGLHLVLTKTRIGKEIQAVSQNLIGATVIGINTGRVYTYTMSLATALAGLSGILIAIISTADPNMGQPLLLVAFVVVIVAGLGSIPGVMIVGLAIGIVEALFCQYVSSYYKATFIYGIVVLTMLFKPEGLFGRK